MLNVGYIEVGGAGVSARVYYDVNFTPVGPSQPLVNGPRGWCLDVTNTTGGKAILRTVEFGDVQIPQGDPVTSGQGRSRTAAQVSAVGWLTRGDVRLTLEG